MKITKPTTNELRQLVKVYKEAFPIHNIFQKSEQEVFDYLEQYVDNILVVISDDKELIGGLVVVFDEKTSVHTRARLKHIAIAAKHQEKGIGSALVKEAEKLIGKGKIEIHLSENEKEAIIFYKKCGYELEGELKSHYRPNETCYMFGKVI